jgi:hypothetical protein
MRVYLLSVYEENGAEDMTGTTDPEKLPELLRRYFVPAEFDGPMECCGLNHWDNALKRLDKAKAEGFTAAGGQYELGRHWGGPQLHVVDLA